LQICIHSGLNQRVHNFNVAFMGGNEDGSPSVLFCANDYISPSKDARTAMFKN
jgi:hypothetical protein